MYSRRCVYALLDPDIHLVQPELAQPRWGKTILALAPAIEQDMVSKTLSAHYRYRSTQG